MKSLLLLFLMTSTYRFGEEVDEQSYIEKPDDENKMAADFIICVPKDMTKTY